MFFVFVIIVLYGFFVVCFIPVVVARIIKGYLDKTCLRCSVVLAKRVF
jgi:hypothetical protein